MRLLEPSVITAFGSCRVLDPCLILEKQKRIRLAQDNIFGFVHTALEILQQFQLICGVVEPPARLRGFLNVADNWKAPESLEFVRFQEAFHRRFATTDVFVVEVSSVRVLLFKTFFLQIHRTREILMAGGATEEWWRRLLRTGSNDVAAVEGLLSDSIDIEVVRGLISYEQGPDEILRCLLKIARFLQKPVLFVSTFNTDYEGKPVPQRTVLAEALTRAAAEPNCAFFDPTQAVLDHGLKDAILDLGHYRPEFEPVIADLLLPQAEALRARPMTR